MSRGPFQTNSLNDFMYCLVWSRKPEMPVSGMHKTWHLSKAFQLSTSYHSDISSDNCAQLSGAKLQ